MSSSLVAFDWGAVLPSFRVEELLSPDTLAHNCAHVLDEEAARKLQAFRDEIYKDINSVLIVNHGEAKLRGVRSPKEQAYLAKLGVGAENHSMHVTGRAFDISLSPWRTYTTEWLAKRAELFGWTGVGTYDTFVHCDLRLCLHGCAATWDLRRRK